MLDSRRTTKLTVIIALIYPLAILSAAIVNQNETKKPFRVIWNYPDSSCHKRGVDFHLSDYGMERNEHGRGFIGDTIALYYTNHGAGRWPYVRFGREKDVPVNGGWPHKVEIESHLKHLQRAISTHQSPGSSGFGVLDMELWRPILTTNYGSFSPYRKKFVEYINQTYTDRQYTIQELRSKAAEMWAASAKFLMLASLNKAKAIRPHAFWGYYRYPELVTAKYNHQLSWLWEAVTAYYPSIYIHNYFMPIHQVEEHIKRTLAETFRVRALYGDVRHPIMVYVDVQTIPDQNKDEWLRLQLQVPIDMGVDGVILWASSSRFTPNTSSKCRGIQHYVTDTLGPYISELARNKSSCSERMCSNRGRCVKKSYAKSIPYLLGSVNIGGNKYETEKKKKEKKKNGAAGLEKDGDDYLCQCYTGWVGELCSRRENVQ